VHQQTEVLAARAAAESETERQNARLQRQRSRILEDINGPLPLVEVLEEITELVSFQLHGSPCWCEIADGARLGRYATETRGMRIVQEPIAGRSGPPLGTISAAIDPLAPPAVNEKEAFFVGSQLAALAIENRRLYSDLVHRSEFDLLTDVHNRFSLERQLDTAMMKARESAGVFGLIYVDLDEFKQINDLYGHRVGDLYLQEVSGRMKRQLRSADLLARVGGDEFAVLVPMVRNREDVIEIASRMENCFVAPINVDRYVLHGTASLGIALYPEDGSTRDTLMSAADAAMYAAKNTRRVHSS
jgi:diguanylate cyclase (GGDEF)-like protein